MIDPCSVGGDALPHDRRAPEAVLRDLAAIHPHATLLYVGGGRWWLGLVVPDSESADGGRTRRTNGATLLAAEAARPPALRSYWRLLRGRLLLAGFRYVHTFRGPPSGRIVEWFREADWRFRHAQAERFAEVEALTNGSADRAQAQRDSAAFARDVAGPAWRSQFRRPIHLLVNGFRQVRDRLASTTP